MICTHLLLVAIRVEKEQCWNRLTLNTIHKFKFQFHSTVLLAVHFSIDGMSKTNENYALSLSINEYGKRNTIKSGMTICQSHILCREAWNLPIGQSYSILTHTLTLHVAVYGVPAMECNAIWWIFFVFHFAQHIQHELNKSNQLLVRRALFSIFAVSCWNGECDSDTFAMHCWAELSWTERATSWVCLHTCM